METVNLTINGLKVSAPAGSTILEAAHPAGIRIPTLCYLKEINEIGACRMCVVEVKGARNLVAACVHPVSEGMEVYTNTPKLISSRKKTLQLLLSNHDKKCLSCVRSGNCELQQLCREYGVDDENYFAGESNHYELDDSAAHMIRDNNKCILCRRCVAVCEKVQGVGVIGTNNRGFATFIGSAFDMGLGETSCVSCGQCIAVCPTGALYEKDYTDKIIEAIADPEKYVVVQTAPSVRAALGEEFGYPMGTDVEGKMVAALRRIGFDRVFDTDWAADLTIMEEAHELLDQCTEWWKASADHILLAWMDQILRALFPGYDRESVQLQIAAADVWGDGEDLLCREAWVSIRRRSYAVSVMPCTAKKFEIGRDHQNDGAGVPDVDIAITTRELARLIRSLWYRIY